VNPCLPSRKKSLQTHSPSLTYRSPSPPPSLLQALNAHHIAPSLLPQISPRLPGEVALYR
jgi:hypothetical protein